jgi:predicted CopG family antitoxin
MPEELLRFENKLTTTKNNILDYTKQLQEEFPYISELAGKKQRLTEVDTIIINKTKTEDAAKELMKENKENVMQMKI